MSVDYSRITSEIAEFIGTPEADWDSRTTSRIGHCISKGIDSVLHNGMHQWTWMRPIWRLDTSASQRRYLLPLDFEQFIEDIHYDGTHYGYPSVTQLPVARLLQLHTDYDGTGTPRHYAIEPIVHDGATEQRQQVVFHPTPDGTYSLVAQYQVGPIRAMSASNPYPPGGPENGELFVAAILAAVESAFLDSAVGDKHDEFRSALAAAIARDHRRQPRNLGPMRQYAGRQRHRFTRQLSDYTRYEGSTDV